MTAPPRLLLRRMTLADVDAVAALDARAFGESGWSRRYFVGELTDSRISIFYVLTESTETAEATERVERILAYFGTWHVVDQLHLCTFAVDPDRHGQGLGRLLLDCVIRLAQRLECAIIQLEVRESNQVARALYRSRGFSDEAVRRNLYAKPPEDGILMGLSMPAPSVPTRQRDDLTLQWDDRGGRRREHSPATPPRSEG